MPRAALSNVSIKQLVAELKKRQAQLADLIKQRDALNTQIEELQGLAGAETAAAPGGRNVAARSKKAPKRATGKPLAGYVRDALAAAPKGLRVKDIEAQVRAAGYPTKAANLSKRISAVLAKGGFKWITRGVYALKAGAPAGKKVASTAKAARPASKAKKPARRGVFSQTADQFVLGLVKDKPLATAEINAAWKKAGRGADADATLSKLTKAGKLKRAPLPKGQRGSTYRVS